MKRVGRLAHVALGVVMCLIGCGADAAPAECPDETSGGEAATATATIEEDIRELLVLTNAIGNTQHMMEPMISALAQAYPAVPAHLWSELMRATGDEEFVSLLIDVYKRHYTQEEVRAMLRFNRSPIGRSIVAKMPAVITEGQQAGAVWGQRLAEKLIEGARSRGYEL